MYVIKAPVQNPSLTPGTAKWMWEQRHGYYQHRRLNENTANNYSTTFKRFVAHFEFVSEPLTESHVSQYAIQLKKDVSDNTYCSMVNQIRAFFKYLNAFDLYENKVYDRVLAAKPINTAGKYHVVTDEQFQSMLDAINLKKIDGLRNYAILRLVQSTGIRAQEISNLLVSDLIERPIVEKHDPNTIVNAHFIRFKQKRGYETERRIFPKTLKAIKKYHRARGLVKSSSPMFVSHSHQNYGRKLHNVGVTIIVKKLFTNAGIVEKGYSTHAFRATLAVKILRATGSEEEAGNHLGHMSRETIKIYTASERATLIANNQQNYEL